MEPDFSGWATKANLKCTDGRTIMPDAFKHQDKMQVPLVWQHGHADSKNVLGHAVLEARPEGVYTYGFFNETESGQGAKQLVEHGDVQWLSIYANQLVEKSKQVFHGAIGEVSLVLAGANPGAKIDFVAIRHSDGTDEYLDDEAVITTGLELEHDSLEDEEEEDLSHEDGDEKTVKEVYDSLTDEQKDVVHYMIGAALEAEADDAEHSNNDEESLNHQEGNDDMTRNVFEQNGGTGVQAAGTLTHGQLQELTGKVVADFNRHGSFKDAVLAHAGEYGITNVEVLFPEAKTVDGQPEWLTRKMEWVDGVLNGARKLPFARIKSRSADLTHEEARAKGYIKGNLKKEQFFAIAQRETTPTTIYKKQKLDRDDIIDITEFNVVTWIWQEMRFMLKEEIARAVLVGDGRPTEDPANPGSPNPDKINEVKIRPIAKDDDFYTHRVEVPSNISGESLIEALLRSRKFYKGAGNPAMYTTEDTVTDLLLLKDKMGRRLYPTEAELRSALRVSAIIPVDIMEDQVDEDGNGLVAVLVNMSDYSIGTDKGGEITTFDDFDIDYNQHKYLIEGRMSGALTQHKRAIAVWRGAGTSVTPDAPAFDAETNTITIPTVAGVGYYIDGAEVSGDVVITEDTLVEAVADDGYYFPAGTTTTWNYVYTAA